MNVANVFVVGFLSSLIGAGIAYFVLIRSADFQWWWLITLFGAQFLSVIVVAYALKKTLSFNNMFCETPAVITTYDWSSLKTTPVAAPILRSDSVSSVNDDFVPNSADWEDLLLQLDQMEKVPVVAPVSTSTPTKPTVAPTPSPVLPPQPQTTTQGIDFAALFR